MPIQSVSEFEATINKVFIAIDKVLVERGDVPALKEARRVFERAQYVARDGAKLKAMVDDVTSAGDTVRETISDTALGDVIWDLVDFIDYRVEG